MFPSRASETTAIVTQLCAALECYAHGLEAFTVSTDHARFLNGLEDCFGDIQVYASSLPQLSVSWGGVLISRAEFVRSLWTRMPPPVALLLRDEHLDAVRLLHKRCERLMAMA